MICLSRNCIGQPTASGQPRAVLQPLCASYKSGRGGDGGGEGGEGGEGGGGGGAHAATLDAVVTHALPDHSSQRAKPAGDNPELEMYADTEVLVMSVPMSQRPLM